MNVTRSVQFNITHQHGDLKLFLPWSQLHGICVPLGAAQPENPKYHRAPKADEGMLTAVMGLPGQRGARPHCEAEA